MNTKKLMMIIGGIAIAIVLSVVYATLLWGVYIAHWDTPYSRAMANVFYIPVARVGEVSIPVTRYYKDLDSLRTYLSSDIAKESGGARELTDDDRKQAIERLIEEAVIEEMAGEKKLTLTNEEIEEAIDTQFVTGSSTRQDLEKEIGTSYGWSMQDFKDHIVRPILLERKLASLSNPTDSQQGLTEVVNALSERVQGDDVVRYIQF